jgi:plasmid stabilization system protein ParE
MGQQQTCASFLFVWRVIVPGRLSVARPRHVLVFRLDGDVVVLIRVLHEAMNFPDHLDDV